MDAVKYLRERKRICDKYEDCDGCPMSETNNRYGIICGSLNEEHPEEAVAIVEKWSKEHPAKTRQSAILNVFPNAKLLKNGAIVICPKVVETDRAFDCCRNCDECRKNYWLADVE